MLSHHQTLEVRVLLQFLLLDQPQIEPGTLPGNPSDFFFEYLTRQSFLISAGSDRNDRNRVHMVYMTKWNQAMQRSINGTRGRVETKRGMTVHIHHGIFDLGLHTF